LLALGTYAERFDDPGGLGFPRLAAGLGVFSGRMGAADVGDTTLSETWKSQAAPPLLANSSTALGRSARLVNVLPPIPKLRAIAANSGRPNTEPASGRCSDRSLCTSAVSAVVHHDDQDVHSVVLHGFELLDVRHQAAVARIQ
jgi:hypothetical protein